MKYFIAVHLIVSFMLLVFSFRYDDNEKRMIYFIFILLLPIVGVFFIIINKLFDNKNSKSHDILKSYEYYISDVVEKDNNYLKMTDFKKEINVISAEEALLINNNQIKREIVVDILKEDYGQYIDLLKKALEDEDIETSHYAAAAITKIKGEFQTYIQKLEIIYHRNENDIKVIKEYIVVLKKYLQSGFLDKTSVYRYKELYNILLKKLLILDVSDQRYFIDKIQLDIEKENYSEAKQYCDMFYKHHKYEENSYLMYLNLYYVLKDYGKFKKILMELRESSVVLSNNGLNSIRFWLKEDEYEKKNY